MRVTANPMPNTRRPHPLEMAVHQPEPMPEPWLDRHAGKAMLLSVLVSAGLVVGVLYLVHLALCALGW